MAYDPGHISTVHQSQSECLARLKAEHDNPGPQGFFATIGTLCHEIIEQYTVEQAEHPQVAPRAVVREILALRLLDPDVTPSVAEEVVTVMSGAFAPRSDLRFTLCAGYETVPEWKWALDDEFAPITMDEKGAWTKTPAFSGAIDRLEFGQGKVVVWDWKSTLARERNEDQKNDKQAKWYSVAALAHFVGVPEVEWRKALLRHGYAPHWTFKRDDDWHEATKARMRSARAKRLEALEKDAWPETPGPSCHYCPVIHRCATMQALAASGGTLLTKSPTEIANGLLALRAVTQQYENAARGLVETTKEPIPLEDGEGSALGMKPVTAWTLTRSYEATMNELEALQMSPEQRILWFRHVAKGDLASRVRTALGELVGKKVARQWIEAGMWMEPHTEHEFGVWVPDRDERRVPLADEELDDVLDRLFDGG